MEEWRRKARAVRERVTAAHAHRSLRHAQHRMQESMICAGRAKSVARVFKGNIVVRRLSNKCNRSWILAKLDAFLSRHGLKPPPQQQQLRVHQCSRFEEERPSLPLRVLRSLAVPLIGNVCHVFMHGLNSTEVYGLEKLQSAILQRNEGTGLVTVSNHVAAMDDPLVTASLLSPTMLLDERTLRWTLCATDRCFTSAAASAFFTCVKVLPVSRGEGIHQQGMNSALEKLNRGDWVHIFPEGSRSRDGGKSIRNAKRGVGRLVVDASRTPLIIPYVHDGMQDVMPIGSKFPHICKRVTILVGDPIPVDDLMANTSSEAAVYDVVAERVSSRMRELKQELDTLVLQRAQELDKQRKLRWARRGSGIWQQVDWEMQGFSVDEVVNSNSSSGTNSSSGRNECTCFQQRSQQGMQQMPMSHSFLGGITSRLKSYADSGALLSFAARAAVQSGA